MKAPAKSQLQAERNVLVVDDEAGMRMALELSYGHRGWRVETAAGKSDALCRFRRAQHPLVVSDVRMTDGNGFELLSAVRAIAPETSVIMLTAFGAVPDAVLAMKSGACEYLTKPVAFEQLLQLSEQVLMRKPRNVPDCLYQMIGSSPALSRAIDEASQAAQSDADVLIEAESGTGKELLARMIHARSARRERPFVAVNCAALPEALLESELFGHARGAFTGAFAAQAGKIEIARGGTLLLDEVGEIPLNLQPKLLRVLQEREFYRLGENNPTRIDVRIVATTNRRLSEMVEQGSFRADLYYRLNVIPLSLPPLRERQGDIRELALHFARLFASSDAEAELPEEFLARLEQHSWPGNVRELANCIRRTVALKNPGTDFVSPLAISHRKRSARVLACQSEAHIGGHRAQDSLALAPGVSIEAAERRLLEITLAATAGNRSRAADMLGISLRTVRNKIREYKLPARSDYAHLND